ncbi:hypothetical protein BDZ97DRAFT_1913633 [Flammula alnicola]|nr:hypothetical protein BDZ97DRAFT_1913633 [Flammula alnicola]
MEDFRKLKRTIQLAELDLLRALPIDPDVVVPEDDESAGVIEGVAPANEEDAAQRLFKDDIKQIRKWIAEQAQAIKKAKDNHGSGNADIDFNIMMLNFLESAATYYRSKSKVLQAVKAIRAGDTEKALKFLNESQKKIDEIAALLDAEFVVAADFVDGTKTLGEWAIDASYVPQAASGDTLYGCDVHAGFYQGLFGSFKGEIPFEHIVQALQATSARFSNKTAAVGTHHTLVRRYNTTPGLDWSIKDLATFGGPRVALQPLADLAAQSLAEDQHSWRVCNKNDIVCTIPPPIVGPRFRYIHLDDAWMISANKPAQPVVSERPDNPVPPLTQIPNFHFVDAYYRSLKNQLTASK